MVDEDTDEERTYHIVGEPEADIEKGRLNIKSPLARALIGKDEGDSVEVSTPGGAKSYADSLDRIRLRPLQALGARRKFMSDDYRDERTDTDRVRIARNLKMTPVEIGALIFAIVWVLICIVFFFGLGGTEAGTEKNGVGFVVVVSSVLVPIAVVWLAVSSARAARIVTDESERLQASMSAMRKVMIEVQEFQALGAPRPEERTRRLESAAAAPKLPGAESPAMFASSRPHGEITPPASAPGAPEKPAGKPTAPQAAAEPPMRDVSPQMKPVAQPAKPPAAAAPEPAPADTQASLKLDTPQDSAGTVDVDDLVRAINFPENAEDEEGFEALRRTLVDRKVATLIQAAQDVLTLLSQDGIYMDDLSPDPARPEIWRQFAGGQRGQAVAELGGIHDRSSLALSSNRMKSDPIFRDASMHFLRRFDEVLSAFEPRMADAQVARFATTRTARAFMLLGRVTGTFD